MVRRQRAETVVSFHFSTMENKLYVRNLAYQVTNDDLAQFFAQAGTVSSASVVMDRMSGRSRGFGFVEMATAEEAQSAIDNLDGKDLMGRPVQVMIARPKTDDDRGARGPRRPRNDYQN